MLQYFDTLTDLSGNALPGATVTVNNYPSNTPANIYSQDNVLFPILNSTVVADQTGQINFFAPDGVYSLVYTFQGNVYKTRAPVTISIGIPIIPQTAIETSAGITPSATQYDPTGTGAGTIRRYGGVEGSDIGAAMQSAATAYSAVTIPAGGPWPLAAEPSMAQGTVVNILPNANVTGAGAAAMGLTSGARWQIIEPFTSPNDFATLYIRRNANHVGGTPGGTENALRVDTYVTGTGITNFEWAFLATLQNSATAGQNVAGYFQGNKVASNSGPTWGGVVELRELVAINNPSVGTVGLEVDHRSNGTDSSGNRVGLDLVCTRFNTGGVATTVTFGYRVQNNNDTAGTNCVITNAFSVWQATCAFAFDCASSTVTSGSLRMAAGVPVLFDASGAAGAAVNKLVSTPASGLDHQFNGSLANRLLGTGGLQVGASQVVGPRVSLGYGSPTGNVKVANFPGATATLLQTSETLAQLLLDLLQHGLIGA